MSIETLPEAPPASPVPPAPPAALLEAQPQPEPDVQSQPQPAPAHSTLPRWPVEAQVVAWVILAFGAIFRVRAWFHWRSLWLDELYVAHSIVTRGIHDLLFQPLDYWQGAPAGFLVLTRLCVDLFGAGERSLRLVPLLAGLASLPLFYYLARRLLSLRAALLAILLFASLRPLVYYSAEVKQYSMDVACTLAILLAAVSVWQSPRSWLNRLIYLAGGAILIFFSHPAIFILAATWLVLFGYDLDARNFQAAALFAGGLVWAGLEFVNIRFLLWPLMHGPMHDGLVRDWIQLGAFPPAGPDVAAAWVWDSFRGIMAGYATMYLRAADLGMFAAVVGLASLLWGKRRTIGLFLLLPLLAAVIAAFAKRFPLGDRLALYLVPLLTLLIAEGIDQIWSHQNMARSAAGVLAMLMLIPGSVLRSVNEFWYPAGREETKPIYQWIQRNWRSGDMLVLSHMAEQSFDYYAPQIGLAGLEQLWTSGNAPAAAEGADQPRLEASAQGMAQEPWFYKAFNGGKSTGPLAKGYVVLTPDFTNNPALYLDAVDNTIHPDPAWHWPPVKRVWVVFDHYLDEQGSRVDRLCVMELERRAEMKICRVETGADAYLYEVTDTPSAYIHD